MPNVALRLRRRPLRQRRPAIQERSISIGHRAKRPAANIMKLPFAFALLSGITRPPRACRSQSIQGFVYWDADFNGILSEGVLSPHGAFLNELGSGAVDVRVEVKRCGGEGETIAKGTTGWLDSQRPSYANLHSGVHSKAGYYKIDVGVDSRSGGGCSVDASDDDGADRTGGGAGCYLAVSSPKDYEITTTFPLPFSHGFYGLGFAQSQEMNSVEEDVFTWIPFNDMGPLSYEKARGDHAINRGYQTRTAQCFGYSADNSQWYIWKDGSFASDAKEEDESSGAIAHVSVPNAEMYGYDKYLVGNSYNYQGVLSISPVGMAKNMWPLPLRVKSDVILGLKFQDTGALNGQFGYRPTSQQEALAASTVVSQNVSGASDFLLSSDRTEAADEYAADRSDGIPRNVRNLEDVFQNFLKRNVLEPSRDSGSDQMLTTLNVVASNHWSMVKITDDKASSNEKRHVRRTSTASTAEKIQPHFAPPGSKESNLRGGSFDHRRILASMPAPHVVFHFQVYGTYGTGTNSEVDSIIQTVDSFGKLVSWTINEKKEELMRSIRTRTGRDGPDCYRSPASDNGTEGVDLSQYNVISIGSDSDTDSTTRFACDDLLPLYFYDLKSLVAREMATYDGDLTEDMQLAKALEALKREDDFYDPNSMLGKKSSSSTPSWIYIIVSIVAGLAAAACGAGWIVYERNRRAMIRQRKRILKRERSMKKAEKKKLRANGEGSHKVEVKIPDKGAGNKANDNGSSSDNDIDSLKTYSKTTLDQSNLSGLDHFHSHKSGLNYSTSSRADEVGVKEQSQKETSRCEPNHIKGAGAMSDAVETPPNTKASKKFGNAFASFRKTASQRVLGGLDISDDSSSDSDSSSKIEDEAEEGTKPTQPDRRRRALASAMKNVRSSLTRAEKTSSRHVQRGQRVCAVAKRAHSSSSSSSDSDSDSSSFDSTSEAPPAKHMNHGLSARNTSKSRSPSRKRAHSSSSSSSSDSDSDEDNCSDGGSINIGSDSESSSSGSSSSLFRTKKASQRRQKPAVEKTSYQSTAMHSVSDSHLLKPDSRYRDGVAATKHKRRASSSDAKDVPKPKDEHHICREPGVLLHQEKHSSRPSKEKYSDSKMPLTHKHRTVRKPSQPELDRNMHGISKLKELEPSKSKSTLNRHKRLEKRPAEKQASKNNRRPMKSNPHPSNDRHSSRDANPREAPTKASKDQKSRKKPLKETSKTEPELMHPTGKASKSDNHQQLHESVLTKTAEYLPHGLEHAASQGHAPQQSLKRTNSSKSINNAIDCSSSSRNSSRPRSTRERHELRPSHEVSRSKSRRKHDTSKPDPPSRSKKKLHSKPTLRKLNSLKSSLKSSLQGKKLSGAATKVLHDDMPDGIKKREKKPSKSRSNMKSSNVVRANEQPSSNVRAKSSKHLSSRDTKKGHKHRHTDM